MNMRGLQRELESPSVKLTDSKTGASAPMQRKEIIDDKITSLETQIAKIRKLKETEDSRDILRASIALHEYARSAKGTGKSFRKTYGQQDGRICADAA